MRAPFFTQILAVKSQEFVAFLSENLVFSKVYLVVRKMQCLTTKYTKLQLRH